MSTRRSFLAGLVASPVALAAFPGIPVEYVWRTATGEMIPISKLGDNHLLNIERMLRGDGAQGWYWPADEPIGEGRLTKREEHKLILKEVVRRGLVTREALPRRDNDDDFLWIDLDEDGWPE